MQVTEPEAAKSRLNFDREQTLGQIADLEREFAAIVASAADGSSGSDDEHDPEGATVAFERQHVAALLDRARTHLEAIDAASRKIDVGQLRNMRYMRPPDWRRAPRRAPGLPDLRPLRRHPLAQPRT